MAIGDDTTSVGWLLVPNEGEDGKVRYGAREINRTRDYVAQVKKSIPTNKAEYRIASGITFGTAAPSGGEDGDVYFQYM